MNVLIRFFLALLLTTTNLWLQAHEVLFSPDDRPTNRLVQLIDQATTRIHAAVYMITDHTIAQALIRAKQRRLDVQLVVDQSSVETSYGKGKLLAQNAISVFVFSPGKHPHKNTFHSALMHNKFALIDNRLWNGSFNWTMSANKKNQENVIIIDDQAMCQKFEKQFQVLKQRCLLHGKASRQTVNSTPQPTSPPIPQPAAAPGTWWQNGLQSIKEKFVAVSNYIKQDIQKVMA